ncbi:MAG: hypothetical protein GY817_01085 [bacterium]|nr:hypothetical protein [bacterium]
MSQDSYKTNPAIGYAGLEQGIGDRFARSFINPTDVIPFGRGVVKEAAVENGIKLPSTSSDRFEGISIAARGEQVSDEFALNKDIPVLKRGSILVAVEEAVNGDDDVYMRFDGKSQVQTITFDADLITGNTIDLKIDGVAMTQVAFNSDHATTMGDIATQILANFSQIATCTVDTRTLTLTQANHGTDFAITEVTVLAGTSQAGATVAETIEAISDSDKGKFRNDADSTTAVKINNARFTKDSVDGLVEIDINVV